MNRAAPAFTLPLTDVTLTVGKSLMLNLPGLVDNDLGDVPSLSSINFGTAASFTKGTYPSYTLTPLSNNVGNHKVTIKVTDDNQNPK